MGSVKNKFCEEDTDKNIYIGGLLKFLGGLKPPTHKHGSAPDSSQYLKYYIILTKHSTMACYPFHNNFSNSLNPQQKFSYPITNGKQADNCWIPETALHQNGIYIKNGENEAP